jgi:flagellin-like protein
MRSRVVCGLDRGQSNVIGTVLLLGIVIVGVGATVAFGTTALQAVNDQSRSESVEHAMTQFDSTAAMVALGRSSSQEMTLAASGEGGYNVDDDAGWVRVSHTNHSGTGSTELLTNTSLGAVVYEGDDTRVVYQGGGVWRGTGNESLMLSPPEVHYRGSTLTFPIISVNGSGGAAGEVTAGVSIRERSAPVFPNESQPDYGNASYRNPIETGNVTVTVHSDHYVAWAEYLTERTSGDVSIDHANGTATATLTATDAIGDFEMPSEGNSVPVRGIKNGHGITDFSVSISVDRWNQIQWSFHDSEGNAEFELHVSRDGGGNNCGKVDEIDLGVYYYNGTTDQYQGWQNESVTVSTDPDADVTRYCGNDTLRVDFTGTTQLGYDAVDTGGRSKWHYASSIDGKSIAPTTRFDQHDVDTQGGRNGQYNHTSPEETEQLGFVVAHYLAILGPNADLSVSDGPATSNSIDESTSTGTLNYDQAKNRGFLTFLHVTENEIQVDFD